MTKQLVQELLVLFDLGDHRIKIEVFKDLKKLALDKSTSPDVVEMVCNQFGIESIEDISKVDKLVKLTKRFPKELESSDQLHKKFQTSRKKPEFRSDLSKVTLHTIKEDAPKRKDTKRLKKSDKLSERELDKKAAGCCIVM